MTDFMRKEEKYEKTKNSPKTPQIPHKANLETKTTKRIHNLQKLPENTCSIIATFDLFKNTKLATKGKLWSSKATHLTATLLND